MAGQHLRAQDSPISTLLSLRDLLTSSGFLNNGPWICILCWAPQITEPVLSSPPVQPLKVPGPAAWNKCIFLNSQMLEICRACWDRVPMKRWITEWKLSRTHPGIKLISWNVSPKGIVLVPCRIDWWCSLLKPHVCYRIMDETAPGATAAHPRENIQDSVEDVCTRKASLWSQHVGLVAFYKQLVSCVLFL